jgi:hypothetical protein
MRPFFAPPIGDGYTCAYERYRRPLDEGNAENPRGVDEVLEVVRSFKSMFGGSGKILSSLEKRPHALIQSLPERFEVK